MVHTSLIASICPLLFLTFLSFLKQYLPKKKKKNIKIPWSKFLLDKKIYLQKAVTCMIKYNKHQQINQPSASKNVESNRTSLKKNQILCIMSLRFSMKEKEKEILKRRPMVGVKIQQIDGSL
jgi:uncharacterized membrane protein YhiD involved in acid resistance